MRDVEGLRGMQTEMKMPPLRSELSSEIPIYPRHHHEVAQEHQWKMQKSEVDGHLPRVEQFSLASERDEEGSLCLLQDNTGNCMQYMHIQRRVLPQPRETA